MDTIDIVLTDLTFPANLEDKFCKFRPLISIRYRDSKDKIVFAREAMPGLGKRDYWECEKDNKSKPDYVRDEAGHKVDMEKLDPSRREIIFNDLDSGNRNMRHRYQVGLFGCTQRQCTQGFAFSSGAIYPGSPPLESHGHQGRGGTGHRKKGF